MTTIADNALGHKHLRIKNPPSVPRALSNNAYRRVRYELIAGTNGQLPGTRKKRVRLDLQSNSTPVKGYWLSLTWVSRDD